MFAISDWKKAVCEFSDAVQAFCAALSPKASSEAVDKRSFEKFRSERAQRRSLAEK